MRRALTAAWLLTAALLCTSCALLDWLHDNGPVVPLPKDCSVMFCPPDTRCEMQDEKPKCVAVPSPPPTPSPSPSASPCPDPTPSPLPSPDPVPSPSPSSSPTPAPTPEPTPTPSPEPTPTPSPVADGCFPPTKPHDDGTCLWGSCLTTCPPVANYGIYFERIVRNGKEVCRGHLGNPGGQVPGCFFYAEKQGKSLPGDKVSFGMTPRGSNSQRDPVTGKDSCCWYGDGRRDCELPAGCPQPPGEFKPIGYTGMPCKLNDPFSITCFPASKGWKMLACPPEGMVNPATGQPFMGTQGCNQRVLP